MLVQCSPHVWCNTCTFIICVFCTLCSARFQSKIVRCAFPTPNFLNQICALSLYQLIVCTDSRPSHYITLRDGIYKHNRQVSLFPAIFSPCLTCRSSRSVLYYTIHALTLSPSGWYKYNAEVLVNHYARVATNRMLRLKYQFI